MRNKMVVTHLAIVILLSLPLTAQSTGPSPKLPPNTQGPIPAGLSQQNFTVKQISSNIAEFYYLLTTGPGKYDQIAVQRVTLVDPNGNAQPSSDAVLMVHGDLWPFDQAFFGGISRDSIAAYLASQGVDVWGIDLAWTLVPSTENDFTFMKTWGMQHDINDIETALTFARTIRSRTGSDNGPLTLLAWSRGGWLGYGLLNQESQLACNQQQVKAYVPVDTYFKTDDQDIQAFTCAKEAQFEGAIANGDYDLDWRIYRVVGQTALQSPDVISSPDICGSPYTNLTCSIETAAYPGGGFTPFYHFNAGYFPQNNYQMWIANGLVYTNMARLNAAFVGVDPYENLQMMADTYAVTCGDDPNLPYDKHLADIKVPVHYVGAGGGFGSYGLYTLSLLGSKDKTSHIVSFYPPPLQGFDFAHVDLFYADNAQSLVWNDILNFLQKQEHGPTDKCDR